MARSVILEETRRWFELRFPTSENMSNEIEEDIQEVVEIGTILTIAVMRIIKVGIARMAKTVHFLPYTANVLSVKIPKAQIQH